MSYCSRPPVIVEPFCLINVNIPFDVMTTKKYLRDFDEMQVIHGLVAHFLPAKNSGSVIITFDLLFFGSTRIL